MNIKIIPCKRKLSSSSYSIIFKRYKLSFMSLDTLILDFLVEEKVVAWTCTESERNMFTKQSSSMETSRAMEVRKASNLQIKSYERDHRNGEDMENKRLTCQIFKLK
ncbi:hypothetical protein BpHYR1_000382 [Brachionus plicatilis]|uniref:Uncharacterized protein n=1 Tax=Brachionus plicatilis TaxID=10195 RepID=A0A3M7Q619_BRAPC|nr:hypothetical protein BpHYR1_000382 [Brachionus plicatilis]